MRIGAEKHPNQQGTTKARTMYINHNLTNNFIVYTTNVNLGTPEVLMRMFLSTDGKKKNVVLRHELKEQMMHVTLRQEPSKGA